jgi:hypothetical protein
MLGISLWFNNPKVHLAKKLFHLRFHRGIHLDERRPEAFEAFARHFLRRVNAEFAALPREIIPPWFTLIACPMSYLTGRGDFARGVVELVAIHCSSRRESAHSFFGWFQWSQHGK